MWPVQCETLSGVPDCEVVSRARDARQGRDLEVLQCVYTAPPPGCPQCGTPARSKGRAAPRTVADLPKGGVAQQLVLTAPRWVCPCPAPAGAASRRQPGSFADLLPPVQQAQGRERQYTRRVQAYLFDRWARGDSRRTLAQACGLSEEVIEALVEERLPDLQAVSRYRVWERRPQFLGLDEVFWRGQPITVIMDIGPAADGRGKPLKGAERARLQPQGRVIDILASREPEVLEGFFRQFQALMAAAGQPNWRPVIASDMWGDFRMAIRRVFGGRAIHVADRFHVAAKIAAEVAEVAERYRLLVLSGRAKSPTTEARRSAATFKASQAYRAALKARRTGVDQRLTQTSKTEEGSLALLPAIQELIVLATELDDLWAAQEDQLASLARFREWTKRVAVWSEQRREEGRPLQPFRELIYLLGQEA